MNTIIDETWATAAPLSVADIRDVKYRLTEVLNANYRLSDDVAAVLNDLVDIIGTLEVERFHLAQGALRADMLRRELERGGAGDDLLTLVDTLFMEWSLFVRDRAAGQPNPVARLVSLVVQHEERATRYKAQMEAQAAEIAKLRAQNTQLHEELERAAAPRRMYTYEQSRGDAANGAAERVPAAYGHGNRHTGQPGPRAAAPSARVGEPGAGRSHPSRGSAGVPASPGPAAAPTGGAAALLQWLTAPVATSGQHPAPTGGPVGRVQ
jgi:hypothetical protein